MSRLLKSWTAPAAARPRVTIAPAVESPASVTAAPAGSAGSIAGRGSGVRSPVGVSARRANTTPPHRLSEAVSRTGTGSPRRFRRTVANSCPAMTERG